MLIFTRKKDEAFYIGDVRVVVTDVRGDRVRIGTDAPKSIAVHRAEVYEKIKAENNPAMKEVMPMT
jgi:carbon storage regulator